MKRLGIRGRDVRIGVIGLGCRGIGQMCTLLDMPDVKAAIVCDDWEDRAERGADIAKEHQGFRPDATTSAEDVFARDDIEGVAIFTSWQTHIPLAVRALRAGKYPALEVGGATSVEQLWELVRTSEQTRVPVMLLENCCYDRREMALLNMVRRGLFGELVHCGGGYCHDLREEIGNGDSTHHYRQDNFFHRNGELYPTHDLGPIAKYLDIGRGNAILTVSSTASKARGLSAWFAEHRPDLASRHVCEGDVVDTILRCANGETIHLVHDCSLPRPYSRAGLVQGTKGIWQEDGAHIYLEGVSPGRKKGDWTERWEPEEKYLKRYEHLLWKKYREFGLRGGHGGMDYLVLRAWIESLQNRTPPPIDVYDTAIWMAVTCLSEQSVALNGAPVPMPDFTDGRWMTRKNEDLGQFTL
jgi:predicted dehydrogenase